MTKMYRQGDILLIKVDDVEEMDKPKIERVILGHGEVTGHMHVIEAATVLSGDDLAWSLFARTGEWNRMDDPQIAVWEETPLVHDEHDTLTIEPGIYEVRRQREYEPEAVRYVID